jgi:hypothetical protein
MFTGIDSRKVWVAKKQVRIAMDKEGGVRFVVDHGL